MSDKEADILYIKQRKVRHWSAVLLFLLILTVVVRVRVTEVEVLGNSTYTAEEAEDLIFRDFWDRNTAVIIIRNIAGIKKELPFVADYRIVLKSPVSCELRFYEKRPIGCIRYMSSYMYFDKDGIMIESSGKKLEGVPVVSGLDFGYVVLGKKLPVDSSLILSSITGLTQQLSLYSIDCSRIVFNDTGSSVTIELEDPNIEVRLGSEDYLAAKISLLNDMLPKLKERQLDGVLDLSTYSDGMKNAVSTFKLKEKPSESGKEGEEKEKPEE